MRVSCQHVITAVIRWARTTLNATDRTSRLAGETCTLAVRLEDELAQTMKARYTQFEDQIFIAMN